LAETIEIALDVAKKLLELQKDIDVDDFLK